MRPVDVDLLSPEDGNCMFFRNVGIYLLWANHEKSPEVDRRCVELYDTLYLKNISPLTCTIQ
jgi:hypothetical protein